MCNQAARLSRCLSKVQQGMQAQIRIWSTNKPVKSPGKVGAATEELQYLMNFSTSITQCVAKAIEHLSDFAFVSMTNVTLCRRDSHLVHVKSGLKQDALAALFQAPLDLPTLFEDSVLKRAEEDIARFEDKGRSHGQSDGKRDSRFHPHKRSDRQTQEQRSDKPAWKELGRFNSKKKSGRHSNKFSSHLARGQLSFK